jgi:hypothetical protein
MDPRVAHFEALLAALLVGVPDLDLVEVSALLRHDALSLPLPGRRLWKDFL